MNRNNLRYNRVFRKLFEKNSKTEDKNTVYLKDILIPLFSAMAAIFFQQFFFESNKIAESRIELHKENLKTQTPIINRILAFTYKYELTTMFYSTVERHQIVYVDSVTGKVIKKTEKYVDVTKDTVSITVPSFIIHSYKRNKFTNDLETIKKQSDLLDHNIYVSFDVLLDFLEENKFPDLKNTNEIIKSSWRDEKIQKKWQELLQKLRTDCVTKLDEFENSSS